MQRIVRGLSATLTHTFYVDGVATDPSPATATVTITRDDGTAVVTAQNATRTGAGVFTYTLTPAQTATLDTLAVAWTATFGGQAQTFTDTVEVAGDVLFTIAQARKKKPMNSTSVYSTADIVAMRTTVEQSLEDELGYALVPRYKREKVSGNGGRLIRLAHPYTTAVRSVKLDGAAITDLASVIPDDMGIVDYSGVWVRGFRNYEIVYEHGREVLDGEAREVALELAAAWISEGPSDPRATSMSTDDGTFALATAGRGGARYGIPKVDAFVQARSMSVAVA